MGSVLSNKNLARAIPGPTAKEIAAAQKSVGEEKFFEAPETEEDALTELQKALELVSSAHRHKIDPNKSTRQITPEDLDWKDGFLDKYFGPTKG